MTTIEVGKTYQAHNQGQGITPQTIDVHVVWVSDADVHYRKGSEPTVHKTTTERFSEIVFGGCRWATALLPDLAFARKADVARGLQPEQRGALVVDAELLRQIGIKQ